MMRSLSLHCLRLALCASPFFPGLASGQVVYTYIGSAFDSWENSLAWLPSGPPTSADTAKFDSSTATSSISAATETLASLQMSNGAIGGNGGLIASGLSTISGGGIQDGLSPTFGSAGNTTTGLNWSAGTLSTVGTVTAYGDLDWTGGTLDLTDGSLFGTFINGATAGGIKGPVTWNAGHIQTGVGLLVNSTGSLDVSGDTFRQVGGNGIQVDGKVLVTGTSQLYLSSNTNIGIGSTGVVDFQDDNSITYGVSTPPTLTNNGLIKKSGGLGETVVDIALAQNSGGQINVYSGSLVMQQGGSFANGSSLYAGTEPSVVTTLVTTTNPALDFDSGYFDLQSGSGLSTNAGDVIVGEGATVQVSGTYDVSGGTTRVEDAATLLGSSGTVIYTDGLALNGGNITAEKLIVRETGEWTGGSFGSVPVVVATNVSTLATAPTPTTTSTTEIASSAIFNIHGTDAKTLLNHYFANKGTVYQDASIEANNSVIDNSGLWVLNIHDANIQTGSQNEEGSKLLNTGTLAVTSGGAHTIEVFLENEGSLFIDSSLLTLTGGGNFSKTSSTTVGTPSIPAIVTNDYSTASFYPSLTLRNGIYDFAGDTNQYSTLMGYSGSQIEIVNATVNMAGLLYTEGTVELESGADLNLGLTPNQGYHQIAFLDMVSQSASGETNYTAPVLRGLGGTIIHNGYWDAGRISGSLSNGPVIFGSSENPYYDYISIGSSDQKVLQNRNLMNFAYVDHYQGNLLLRNGHITNYAGWGMSPGTSMTVNQNGGSFINMGEFGVYENYSAGSTVSPQEVVPAVPETVIGAAFTNAGVVYLESDTRFTGNYNQENLLSTETDSTNEYYVETALYNGSTVTFEKGATFNTGALFGEGTIFGNISGFQIEIEPYSYFYTDQDISAAASLGGGSLTFMDNVTLSSSSAMVFKIFGSNSGEYDQVFTAGNFNINNAKLYIDGPTEIASILTSSDYFPLLQTIDDGQFLGMFAGLGGGGLVQVFDFDGNLIGQFNIFYDQFEIALTNFSPVPEPETWALLILGLAAVGWSLRRRRA